MWVVKIGGSLFDDPLLPQWLDLLDELGGGRVTIVCGGGNFADEVRRAQALWRIDDLACHNMAVLAMVQGAYLLRALRPALQMVSAEAAIPPVLRRGHTAVWAPFELLRERADDQTNWRHTGDSIALALARRLNAERLVLVKSCAVDARLPLPALVAAGVLDSAFATAAVGAGCAIDVVQRDQWAQVRSLLLPGHAQPAAP